MGIIPGRCREIPVSRDIAAAMILKIARRWREDEKNMRLGLASRMCRVRCDIACDVLDLAMTPFAMEVAFFDAWAQDPEPDVGARNRDAAAKLRGEWETRFVADVLRRLDIEETILATTSNCQVLHGAGGIYARCVNCPYVTGYADSKEAALAMAEAHDAGSAEDGGMR